MAFGMGPKSIRGKLLLVFLLALSPVLVMHLWSHVSNIARAEELARQEQRMALGLAADSLEAAIAQVRSRHNSAARHIAAFAGEAGALVTIRVPPEPGALWSRSIEPPLAGQPPAAGRAAATSVSSQPGSSPESYDLVLTTPIRTAGGESCCLVTRISGSGLAQLAAGQLNRPFFAGWHIDIGAGKAVGAVESRATDASGSPASLQQRIGAGPWKLVAMPSNVILTAWRQTQRTWMMRSVAASLLGMAIMALLGSRLTRPIRRLARAADAVAVGDFRKRIRVKTGDELERLANSFNSLGDSLVTHQELTHQQAEMISGMVEAARMASASLDLKQCGSAIAKALCTRLGAAGAVVYARETGEDRIRTVGFAGKCRKVAWRRLAVHAAASGGYLSMSPQAAGSDPADTASKLAGIPLTTSAGTLGAIVAGFDGRVPAAELKLGSLRAEVLTAFGVHAGAAIHNAQTHQQAEKYSEVLEDWVEHLSSVMQITDLISPSLNLDEVLEALAKATADVLRADACMIMLLDDEGYLVSRSCSVRDEAVCSLRLPPGKGASGRAYQTKQCVSCYDASKSPTLGEIHEVTGFHGIISSPMLAEDEAIGVITVLSREPRRFAPRDVRLLTSICLHAAVVLRNAERYQKEASIACALQTSLVSEAPETCRGLRFATRYMPARQEARVGGDFYDVTALPGGKVAVAIGDVSGKGLQAAIHLASAKNMLKAVLLAYPDDPAQVLRRLNEALNYYHELSFFVTIFLAVIDPETGRIIYASAGHPPALLLSQGGSIHTLLHSTGTPVGCQLPCHCAAEEVTASPSDILLLYTDGVTEIVQEDGMLGVEGLHRLAFEVPQCTHKELVEHICARLGGAERPYNDDLALLAVAFPAAAQAQSDGGTGERDHSLQTSSA